MERSLLKITHSNDEITLIFSGELSLYEISKFQKQVDALDLDKIKNVTLDLNQLSFLDTAASIFINNFQKFLAFKKIDTQLICDKEEIQASLELVKNQKSDALPHAKQKNIIEIIGKETHAKYLGFLSFIAFLGLLFSTKIFYLKSVKNIRFREIAFEINESAIKALGIVALTSFLIGLVVAYQSAYQLKIYGANIFIVDMLGLSILRELAPLMTAVVIAGRSGSAFTAQIGAMKITEELDAMRTMGFDPYMFLVIPRIIALMVAMPILIFVADVSAVIGGMIIANLDLGITPELFLDRFNTVIDVKHFFVGITKGPFFAFLIASIGVYRGLMVQNDTQSIGFNTTKSVVEAIFAVIICDAIFSIAFTNLGI
ncbi:ABC transporter permease [bacterium]|nr:ABC transporter permease [bacterium]MBU1994691.1 ABC transporter permease [bacterium]